MLDTRILMSQEAQRVVRIDKSKGDSIAGFDRLQIEGRTVMQLAAGLSIGAIYVTLHLRWFSTSTGPLAGG